MKSVRSKYRNETKVEVIYKDLYKLLPLKYQTVLYKTLTTWPPVCKRNRSGIRYFTFPLPLVLDPSDISHKDHKKL